MCSLAGRHVASAGTASKPCLLETLSPSLSVYLWSLPGCVCQRLWNTQTPTQQQQHSVPGNDTECRLPPTIAAGSPPPSANHHAHCFCWALRMQQQVLAYQRKHCTTRHSTAMQQCHVCWNPPKRNLSLVPTRAHTCGWQQHVLTREGAHTYILIRRSHKPDAVPCSTALRIADQPRPSAVTCCALS